MSQFNIESFAADPSAESSSIQYAKKQELLELASHLSLVTRTSMRKKEILNLILEHYVRVGRLGPEANQYMTRDPLVLTHDQQLEYERISLEKQKLQAQKLESEERIALERFKVESQKLESERQITERKLESDRQLEKIRLEFKVEKARMQLASEKEKERLEQEKERLAHEASLAIRFEQEKARLSRENREHEISVLESQEKPFDLAKNSKLVPAFTDYDPEDYFKTFEETALHLNWPRDQWVWLLRPKLTGKAAKVCRHLENTTDYDSVKQAILNAFSISVEGYRQSFRNKTKFTTQTYVEFASDKLREFRKWLKSAAVSTFAELENLIVLEEFKRKLPLNISMYLEDREEKELLKAASLADTYSLIHKVGSSKRPDQNVKPFPAKSSETLNDTAKGSNVVRCSYCKKEGHTIRNCPDPKCKTALPFRNPFNPFLNFKNKTESQSKPVSHIHVEKSEDLFEDYTFDGTVALSENERKHKVRILRDTGGSQSLLLRRALPKVEANMTNDSVITVDLTGMSTVPLANIYLDCPIKKGNVLVGIRDVDFPVSGVTLLLCNDLAGRLVTPNVIVTEKPMGETLELDPDCSVNPSLVVTRSQKNPVDETPVTSIDLEVPNVMSRDNLVKAQKQDNTLSKLHDQAVSSSEVSKSPCFYHESDLLMRFYRPPNRSSEDTWSEKRQIVLPLSVRHTVMEIAHDAYGGHLGVHKTYSKILNCFYWPNMKRDVAEFVRTCHTCQISGKPNQAIPKAPLQPILVPDEPFSKIIIDNVGPLPKTKRGNQYLLTVMCPTTRYPIAIPLRNISAKNIANALMKVFTNFGIPKEIQSDRGSNFTSDLFTKILKELNIKQTLSAAYHPESQGALERWHQTFKSMLRKFCVESKLEWDEGIDFLLFAIREVPQESIGFSPFEMLFGRSVRGPLSVIKEEWLNMPSDSTQTIQQYMDKLKRTLKEVREIARKNLKGQQLVMKEHYDKGSKVRKFKPNDLVLAYLPVPSSPLKAKFSGPYSVVKNVNNNTYIIRTPDRRKPTQIIHVNLLKAYNSRDTGTGSNETAVNLNFKVEIAKEDKPLEDLIPSSMQTNTEVLNNLHFFLNHLSPEHSQDIKDLISAHPTLFNDFPRKSGVLLHDIELVPGTTPIRQHAYRVGPDRKKKMKEEVEYLLRHGLARPSKSPWASPCILVPKEGGSFRFCTDFRKVNNVTIKDLPLIDDLIDSVGQATFVTKLDLLKGYYQVGLTERAKLISAFITPFGLFEYEVMPFGLTNAPSTFQRLVNFIIQDLEGVFCYLDDIIIIAQTWEEHLLRLKSLFLRLKEAGLTINLKKSVFCKATVTYLGHIVGNGNVHPKTANIDAILNCPVPTTRKSLQRFLGLASYYRRFCRNFSSVAAPLTSLTSPKVEFRWTDECQASFEAIKLFLCNNPVLKSPDFNRPFILQIDACDSGAGGVLLQDNPDGVLHPVSYTSSKFKPHQRTYSTIEKEALSLVLALQKYECYLQGASEISVFTDHNPLVFLEKMKSHNQRLLRWSLYLQKFPLKIRHIKGTQNVIADTLSRFSSP